MLAFFACAAVEDSAGLTGTGDYVLTWFTDPTPPPAGEHAEMHVQVVGPDGEPASNLQYFHGAYVHAFLVPHDLASFGHAHQEDEEEVDAEDLREADFHMHAEFPVGGPYLVNFDFAAEDEYLSRVDRAEASGDPAQLAAPVENDATEATDGELTATLVWAVEPVAGQEAIWSLWLRDASGEVGDLVQWGGADAHVSMVDWEATRFLHTHAWYPDMENARPSHDMPHLYPGPELPFRHVFPEPGRYRAWTQFAREAAPEDEYTVAFDIVVG